MTTQNENCPLTRNASGQENGTAIEARGLSSADNGMPAENLSQGKILAPKQASEAANQRPSKENATAESIVGVRAAGGNGTSSKVGRADALTDDTIVMWARDHQREPIMPEGERFDFNRDELLALIRQCLAASPVEQPAAAPIDERAIAVRADSAGVSEIILSTIVRTARKGKSYVEGYGKAHQFLKDAGLLVDGNAATAPAPSPADERAAWDDTRHSLAIAMCGFATRSGSRDLDAAISVLDAITEAGSPLAWLRTAISASTPDEQPAPEPADERSTDYSEGYDDGINAGRELLEDMRSKVERLEARAASANETGAEGVRAWETDDGRVISDEQKQQALRDGGASASSVRPFSIALGRIGAVPAMAAKAVGKIETFSGKHGLTWSVDPESPPVGTALYADALPAPAQADARIDVEAMLRACVPGGDICDPQRIADSIREWFDEHGQNAAQAAARVGLTATVIQKCIDSCAAEYLEDVTGHPEDAAYCRGITDCIDALNRLKGANLRAILQGANHAE
ncbi:hypothetical protein [Burkholderia cepacia]|uniref:hypothetical protein n=1 Tax=Burkholderia cepacia TaxID=292 RepID=UPI002FE0AEF3